MCEIRRLLENNLESSGPSSCSRVASVLDLKLPMVCATGGARALVVGLLSFSTPAQCARCRRGRHVASHARASAFGAPIEGDAFAQPSSPMLSALTHSRERDKERARVADILARRAGARPILALTPQRRGVRAPRVSHVQCRRDPKMRRTACVGVKVQVRALHRCVRLRLVRLVIVPHHRGLVRLHRRAHELTPRLTYAAKAVLNVHVREDLAAVARGSSGAAWRSRAAGAAALRGDWPRSAEKACDATEELPQWVPRAALLPDVWNNACQLWRASTQRKGSSPRCGMVAYSDHGPATRDEGQGLDSTPTLPGILGFVDSGAGFCVFCAIYGDRYNAQISGRLGVTVHCDAVHVRSEWRWRASDLFGRHHRAPFLARTEERAVVVQRRRVDVAAGGVGVGDLDERPRRRSRAVHLHIAAQPTWHAPT